MSNIQKLVDVHVFQCGIDKTFLIICESSRSHVLISWPAKNTRSDFSERERESSVSYHTARGHSMLRTALMRIVRLGRNVQPQVYRNMQRRARPVLERLSQPFYWVARSHRMKWSVSTRIRVFSSLVIERCCTGQRQQLARNSLCLNGCLLRV